MQDARGCLISLDADIGVATVVAMDRDRTLPRSAGVITKVAPTNDHHNYRQVNH